MQLIEYEKNIFQKNSIDIKDYTLDYLLELECFEHLTKDKIKDAFIKNNYKFNETLDYLFQN